MFNKILKILTKRRSKEKCLICKKEFICSKYKSYIGKLGFITVSDVYCSKKCERSMNKAIRKCFNGKKLSKREKLAIKDLRYVDI